MRVKTDDRRQAIISAAIQVFQEEGYDRASMDGIARLTGGSKTTLYGYFKSKQDLYAAAMTQAAESIFNQLAALLDADTSALREVLVQAGDAYLDFLLRPETLATARTIIGEGGASGLGQTLYDNGPWRGIEAVAEFLGAQMRRGRLKSADPVTAALHYKALLEAGLYEPALYRAQPRRTRSGAINDAVDVFLAAYGVEPCQAEDN